MTAKFEASHRREAETVQEFVQRSKLTPEQIAWTESQPVVGEPSLPRLRAVLADAGFADIQLTLSSAGEDLSFSMRVTERVEARDTESLFRLWISTFRAAGYPIGYQEIGIANVRGDLIGGHALTAPLEELGRRWEARTERQ